MDPQLPSVRVVMRHFYDEIDRRFPGLPARERRLRALTLLRLFKLRALKNKPPTEG